VISLILLLIVLGVAMYLINRYVPMAEPIRLIVNAVVVLLVIVGLLNYFGITHISMPARFR
jgi:hypothetical protein